MKQRAGDISAVIHKHEAADAVRVHFEAENHGSIWLFRPLTDAAREWAEEHVDQTGQFWGAGAHQAYVVEHRFIGDIVEGAAEAGLRVRVL
jgi:hypothetical protein